MEAKEARKQWPYKLRVLETPGFAFKALRLKLVRSWLHVRSVRSADRCTDGCAGMYGRLCGHVRTGVRACTDGCADTYVRMYRHERPGVRTRTYGVWTCIVGNDKLSVRVSGEARTGAWIEDARALESKILIHIWGVGNSKRGPMERDCKNWGRGMNTMT